LWGLAFLSSDVFPSVHPPGLDRGRRNAGGAHSGILLLKRGKNDHFILILATCPMAEGTRQHNYRAHGGILAIFINPQNHGGGMVL